jgi:aryl-alcohol dehydrogenase-like predicted oxidoreductase
LYERDQRRSDELKRALPPGRSVKEIALQFVLRHPGVSAAIIGFSSPEQIDEISQFAMQ